MYSGKTFASKLFYFCYEGMDYQSSQLVNSLVTRIVNGSDSFNMIGFENGKTSNFTLSGIDEYIESVSVKIYKLLGT